MFLTVKTKKSRSNRDFLWLDTITESLYDPVMFKQLINDEKFTNVQKAQAGLTKLFKKASSSKSFYRVLRNDEPLGVLIPNDLWEDLIEDMEALSSPNYLKRIAKARKEKGGITLEQLKKELNLP